MFSLIFFFFFLIARQLKSWVARRKIKAKQSLKPLKNTKQSSKKNKNSKNPLALPVNSKLLVENNKSLPENLKSVPVSPKSPPSSIDLIDPAIIFSPRNKKENSSSLVSFYFNKHAILCE